MPAGAASAPVIVAQRAAPAARAAISSSPARGRSRLAARRAAGRRHLRRSQRARRPGGDRRRCRRARARKRRRQLRASPRCVQGATLAPAWRRGPRRARRARLSSTGAPRALASDSAARARARGARGSSSLAELRAVRRARAPPGRRCRPSTTARRGAARRGRPHAAGHAAGVGGIDMPSSARDRRASRRERGMCEARVRASRQSPRSRPIGERPSANGCPRAGVPLNAIARRARSRSRRSSSVASRPPERWKSPGPSASARVRAVVDRTHVGDRRARGARRVGVAARLATRTCAADARRHFARDGWARTVDPSGRRVRRRQRSPSAKPARDGWGRWPSASRAGRGRARHSAPSARRRSATREQRRPASRRALRRRDLLLRRASASSLRSRRAVRWRRPAPKTLPGATRCARLPHGRAGRAETPEALPTRGDEARRLIAAGTVDARAKGARRAHDARSIDRHALKVAATTSIPAAQLWAVHAGGGGSARRAADGRRRGQAALAIGEWRLHGTQRT